MKMNFRIHIVCVFLLVQFSYQSADPRVETTLGPVVGTVRESETGKKIFTFHGIPYIKPPLGQLRFKPPQPADPWTEDFAAINQYAMCPQRLFGPIMGNEDCVVLNVYTPWDPSSSLLDEPLSVMVFFHGGGFVGGSSAPMFSGEPDYLLEHNVVLVTVSYRLGIFGFLSTEDSEAPGNYGLLDQVESLKWVRDNIASFGGNPDQVTIFGESAGSASVHYLMLTPLAKGLFHGVVAQSGVSLCPWALTYIAKQNSQALAKKVGCPDQPSSELIACLQKIDAEKLIDTDIVEEEQKSGMFPLLWSPRVDSESNHPFLPSDPMDLMIKGQYNKVPLLIGHTKHEGAMTLSYDKVTVDGLIKQIETRWDVFCKLNLALREYLLPEDKATLLCTKVREHYVGSKTRFQESKLQYVDLMGHTLFISSIYKASEIMSKQSPLYSYSFHYESKTKAAMALMIPGGNKEQGMVSHADDLLYLFKYPQTEWTTKSPEYEMVQVMTKIWTDFAKNGKPSLPNSEDPWPEAAWPNHKYVVIDKESTIQQNYEPKHMTFLDEIFSNSLFKTKVGHKEEL